MTKYWGNGEIGIAQTKERTFDERADRAVRTGSSASQRGFRSTPTNDGIADSYRGRGTYKGDKLMFETIQQKLGTAGFIIAIMALVAALGGGAYAASGGLSSKQKKEVTKIAQTEAKKFAGKPGPAGATGPAGPAATAGSAGAKGENGAPGSAGAAGAAGAAGQPGAKGPAGPGGSPWTAGGTLPGGKTETASGASALPVLVEARKGGGCRSRSASRWRTDRILRLHDRRRHAHPRGGYLPCALHQSEWRRDRR